MHDDARRPVLGYVLAALAVAGALLARFLLDPLLGDHLPFVTFFVAVAVATWYGGLRPGLVATALGLLLAWYFFVPDRFSYLGATGQHLVGLAAYLMVSLAITGFGEAMRVARRRAHRDQQAAREQREWLRTTLASIGDAVITTDAGGRVTLLNGAAQELTGWTPDEALGRPLEDVFEVVDEQSRQPVENPVQRVLREGRVVGPSNHTVLVRTDGTERPVDDSAAPIRDATGAVTGVVLSFRDVAERRRLEGLRRDLQGRLERQVLEEQAARRAAEEAERRVRSSEERLRLFVEHTPAAVAMLDRDMRYLLVSRRRLRDYGLEGQDVIGRNYYEVFPNVPERWKEIHRRCLAGASERCEEDHFIRPDGQEVWLRWEICPWRDAQGEIGGVLVFSEVITERKRAEVALRESEGRFRTLTDHAPVGIFLTDAGGNCLFVNRRWCEMAGLSGEVAQGQGWVRALHPDDRDRVFAEWYAAAGAGREFAGEYRFLSPSGRVTWLRGTAAALRGETGGTAGFVGTVMDVTEQRAARAALEESEERLRLALEAGRMGVWDWNLRTNEIKWSENLEPVHGLAPGTFGGTLEAFQKLIHPDDRASVNEAVARAVRERASYDTEFRTVRPDGSVRWMAGKGQVFTEGGQPARMVGVGMDVTGRKRAEQDTRFLAQASATLAGLVDYESTLQKVARLAVPQFADWATVDMLDERGALRRVAVAHVDPAKVALAHELHRRFPPDPAAPQGVWNVVRTGVSEIIPEISDDLLVATAKDADLLGIMRELGLRSYIGVPLAARGRVLGAVTFIAAESGRRYDAADLAVAEDLAHRAAVAIENARLYQEVREADRRKDEFLAVLGHELRNPLAPISNALQVLKMPGANGQVAEHAREMMERQVQHMVRLVDDLLDVSRIVRGKVELRKEPVDLATVVARAVETSQPLVEAEGHELTVALPHEPLRVSGDPVRLVRCRC